MDKEKRIAKAVERFWNSVKVLGEDDCWEWQESINRGGYGYLWADGKCVTAHRFSWLLHKGKIPKKRKGYHGMCVLHKCDNRSCVNPKHLFLGTHLDNMKDMIEKGRQKKSPPKQPKEKLGRHYNITTRKLSDDQVREIKILLSQKLH